MLLLDDNLRVLAASAGYRETFPDPAPEGKPLSEIAAGAWRTPAVLALIAQARNRGRAASIDTEVSHPQGPREVRVRVEMAAAGDAGGCVVLSVQDLAGRPSARTADQAQAEEAAALLRETQHRTANSLAIIATILSLKAREAASPEARQELESVRRRVLALALIEHHLQYADPHAPTPVRPFLETLCAQLSASLVGEDRRVALRVEAGEGSQPRRTVVILGLAITELIINALKYAFAAHQSGEIRVEYAATDDGWRASVTDDGCGAEAAASAASRGASGSGSGSGSAIVAALAAQIGAELRLRSGQGMTVELVAPGAPVRPAT